MREKEQALKLREEEQNRKDIDLKVREDEQKQKELKEQRKKAKMLKMIKEEEEKQKQLEYIKIKEWEEKFDREQKIKEASKKTWTKIITERIDKQRILDEKEGQPVKENFSTQLEKLDIDKSKENWFNLIL